MILSLRLPVEGLRRGHIMPTAVGNTQSTMLFLSQGVGITEKAMETPDPRDEEGLYGRRQMFNSRPQLEMRPFP